MGAPKILAFAGATRSQSWNKKLIRVAASAAKEAAEEAAEKAAKEAAEQAARSAADIAEELLKKHKGSVRAALPELNQLGLSQAKAADVVETMFRRSGRDVANRVLLDDGRLILTSVRPGINQPINIIAKDGTVSFGRATLTITKDIKAPIAVSNVVPD